MSCHETEPEKTYKSKEQIDIHLKIIRISLFLVVIGPLLLSYIPASAIQTQFSDANVQVDATHPSTVTPESKIVLSAVLKGKTADNVNLTLSLVPSTAFRILGKDSFYVPELRQDSTLGFSFELEPVADVTEGVHTLNLFVSYMHKELLGDYSKQSFSRAIEIRVSPLPEIVYTVRAPDSVFVGEKFLIQVQLENIGHDAGDVEVTIIPPNDMLIQGQHKHTISKVGAGEKFEFQFELEVPESIDKVESKLLLLKTSYLDTADDYHESTETFPLMVRPRGFLEIGSAGGIWVGPLFISTIVGIGSIASTAIGVIIFAYHLKQKRKEGYKVRKRKE
ncbi:MAG: hypothetical protein ACE5KA_02635 [Nitrososphaerales archaeon]